MQYPWKPDTLDCSTNSTEHGCRLFKEGGAWEFRNVPVLRSRVFLPPPQFFKLSWREKWEAAPEALVIVCQTVMLWRCTVQTLQLYMYMHNRIKGIAQYYTVETLHRYMPLSWQNKTKIIPRQSNHLLCSYWIPKEVFITYIRLLWKLSFSLWRNQLRNVEAGGRGIHSVPTIQHLP